MEILPAIDMMDGKCVRLVQGRYDESTVYGDDPAQMARHWVGQGAKWLHLVDLNGARHGEPREIESVKRVLAVVDVPVQLGGGIRSLETAKMMLELGVSRVIIGTSAALDSDLAASIFGELGEGAILGVDAKDGMVAVKGWEETTPETAVEFAVRMQSLGARRVIYTDISRDGMLAGANIDAMKRMADALDIPVIASGGVSTVEDIRRLCAIENIEGAILGKALYTGALTLGEVLSV